MSNPPGFRVLALSVAGASHLRSRIRCQDFVLSDVCGEALLIVIADGAGSASRGGEGAELACNAALERLKAGLAETIPPEELLSSAAEAARKAVAAASSSAGMIIRDYASTLLLAIARETSIASLQIGDGAIVVRDSSGECQTLSAPPVSEHLNETVFLTAENWMELAQFRQRSGPYAGIAAFTDGLQMLALKMPEATPHQAFFAPLFKFLAAASDLDAAKQQLSSFLSSPKIASRADDDLTLALAICPPLPAS